MLKEWKKKITADINNWEGPSKKGHYLIIAAICLGLLFLLWTPNTSQSPLPDVSVNHPAQGVAGIKAELSAELQAILSQVEGAGPVEVSLTLSSDGLKSYATNIDNEKRTTEEADSTGGDRNVLEESQRSDIAVLGGTALLVEESAPEVVGVLVVAGGAADSEVKERLTDATVTLLNVPPHKVRVVVRKGDAL